MCVYNLEKTACFTGHRSLYDNTASIKNDLKNTLVSLLEKGYDTFISGMAIGFDMLAAELVLELKNEYSEIKLIAAVPFTRQSEKYSANDKIRYVRLLNMADKIVTLSEFYERNVYAMRNRYLVDNSSTVISYLRRSYGGTANTVKYAESRGKILINL